MTDSEGKVAGFFENLWRMLVSPLMSPPKDYSTQFHQALEDGCKQAFAHYTEWAASHDIHDLSAVNVLTC